MNSDQYELFGRIQMILDCAPMSVTLYNSNRVMIECNMEAVKLFGLDNKTNFIRQFNERFLSFFPERQPGGRDTKEMVDWIFKTTAKEKRLKMELMHLTASGEELPTDLQVVRIDYQYSYMYVAYVRDLREEKAAAKKERENSDFIKTLYEASPLFIEIWDDKFNVIDCNDRALNLFKVSSKEEYLSRLYDFFPEKQPCGTPSVEKYKTFIAKALEEGSAKFVWYHIDSTGEQFLVETTFERITRNGKYILVAFNYDLRHMTAQ